MKAVLKKPVSRWDDTGYTLHSEFTPDEVGQLALHLLHNAIIAGADDGEDSAGRRALRLLAPDEVVKRAFDIAEETYRVARERNHIVDIPYVEPAMQDEKEPA